MRTTKLTRGTVLLRLAERIGTAVVVAGLARFAIAGTTIERLAALAVALFLVVLLLLVARKVKD